MSWDDLLPSYNVAQLPIYLPIEVVSHIMRYLPYSDIRKWREIPELLTYYDNVYCWALKCYYEFNVSIERFRGTLRHPADRYLQILSRYDCTPGSENHIPILQCLYRSIEKDNLKLVKYFLNRVSQNDYRVICSKCLNHALQYHRLEIARELLMLNELDMQLLSRYSQAMSFSAGCSGNRTLVKLIKHIDPPNFVKGSGEDMMHYRDWKGPYKQAISSSSTSA